MLGTHPALGAPGPGLATPAGPATSPTLWQYFERGEKMQKTNKFEANCLFCKRLGVYTRVRGEKRMMSGHLRNCQNASPVAKAEGEAVAAELKQRRSTRGRGTTNPAPSKKRKTRPVHATPLVAVSLAEAAASSAGLPPGPPGGGYYDENAPNNFVTNDGVRIAFEEKGNGHPLILVHGWGATGRYFGRNFEDLASSFRVICFDLRGHGDSEKPTWGFHIHRLATDLLNLMDHLNLDTVAVLGCSLGCAVIWAFVELFGVQRISAAMFVEQSPCARTDPDGSWALGSYTVFSEAAVAHTATRLLADPRRAHAARVKLCLSRDPTESELGFFVGESMKCDPFFLARLLADHAGKDWRSVLQLVTCPALVLAGRKSKIFPFQGVQFAADRMPNARLIPFDDGSHWLYYEESDRFNSVVTAFLNKLHSPA